MRFHLSIFAAVVFCTGGSSGFTFAPAPTANLGIGTRSRSSSSKALFMSADTPTVTLGIFGGGTVGGGIVEILSKKQSYFQQLTGKNIVVKKICVRDASKPRDFALPEGCTIVTSYDDILNDDTIDYAVEVMGGTTDAKDVVMSALQKGKSVVTANKALIAKDLPEIEKLLSSLDSSGTQFRYEAAVCGGIPVIRSMQSDFVGDTIQQVSGIINGCTNFMLTAMDRDKKSYEDALAQASELGYAEADPTLDVGGFDARSKLKILMRLAYGMDVDEDEISCRGITELTKIDFEYAKTLGGTIKLLGVASKNDKGSVSAFISPCYVTNDDPLSSVNGATNAIEIVSDNLVSSIYIGQGAGRYPTANSCINDIVALAKGDTTPLPFNPKSETKFANNYESVFFLRLNYRDQVGITRQVGEVCENHGVSIHSILQNPIAKSQESAFAIVTEKVEYASILKVLADIEALDWCKGKPFYMPVLREDWQS
ncbi:hypothetical protein ACHAWU_009516 [Discostella pseudostelligera]|uniref:Homoserine dehydrogenase n=1 Tax=Discostella pseudostelligera TaxID=259834 RepID=A0ABD3M8Z4_9STRA